MSQPPSLPKSALSNKDTGGTAALQSGESKKKKKNLEKEQTLVRQGQSCLSKFTAENVFFCDHLPQQTSNFWPEAAFKQM